MTAQMSDIFYVKEKKYFLVAMSELIGFDPRKYGIIPAPISTACWRGYLCVYDVTQKRLYLRDLYINSKNSVYPDINCVCAFPKAKSDIGLFGGAHWYGHLNIPIEYSGKILIGNDFIQEYYIHMGFQMPWSYKNLIELDFENGVLTNTVNHSEAARKIRKEIIRSPEEFKKALYGKNSADFIKKCFSTDMPVKAWWIK